jgi:hypothetical protein
MVCRWDRHWRASRARRRARSWQFRHLGAAPSRHARQPSDHCLCHRRRLSAAAADGPHRRAAEPHRSALCHAGRGSAAARRQRCRQPHPDQLSSAGAVGPGQVGGAARRAQHPGSDDGRRTAADPRSHRAHAAPLRRHSHRRTGGERRPSCYRRGISGTRRGADHRAGRSVLGRFPAGCGVDRTGIGCDHRRRRDQPAAHRPSRMPK